MGWFSKVFGQGTDFEEVNVKKESQKFIGGVMGSPDTELRYKGPQLFVFMSGSKDSRAVITNLPQQVKDMLCEAPETMIFKDGVSAIHLCFDDIANIRKSVDRLFNSNYGADLGDYELKKLLLEGFLTVDLPAYDSDYLVKTYSASGQALKTGRFHLWRMS